MFSENEIAILLDNKEISQATEEAKNDFKLNQVEMLEIENHDFLALVMMAPPIGIALANGSISLFEDLALNKLARKMSRGGYFMKVDPVAHAMKYLVKHFDRWESRFFDVLKVCLHINVDKKTYARELQNGNSSNLGEELMRAPYFIVQMLSSLILREDADLSQERNISKVEFEKILDIGKKLEIDDLPIFSLFCNTFSVK